MPETPYLRIVSRGASTPRVLELAGSPIRVGRGLRCEVRLGDPSLADVECLLRLRGETWYVQPIASPGRVEIDGRPVRHLRVLAPGVTLKVGDQDLTLATAESVQPGPGSFSSPIPVEAGPTPLARASSPFPETPRVAPRTAHAPLGRETARPSRARPESSPLEGSRERWSRPVGDGRTWEARWRAAAANLKARPSPQADAPRLLDLPDAPEPTRPVAPEFSPVAIEPALEFSSGDFDTARELVAAPSAPGAIVSATTEILGFAPGLVAEATAALAPPIEPLDEPAVAPEGAVTLAPVEAPEALPVEPRAEPVAAPSVARKPRPVRRALPLPPANRATTAEPEPETQPALPELDDLEWPSARVILAASVARGSRDRRPEVRAETPSRRGVPGPTEPREPGLWAPSLVLTWAPMALGLMLLSAVGVKLSWGWGAEASEAGAIADRLLRPEGPGPEGAADAVVLRDAPWWGTTSAHLARKAAALGSATRGGPALDEEVSFLLGVARKASPLETASRSARVRLAGDSGGGLEALGLSHDIVTRTLTARRLAQAGKTDAALHVYRDALDLASRAEAPRERIPAYLNDPAARRFALPNEELIAGIVRDMASRTDWSYAQWSSAIPDRGVALLATYRVLSEREQVTDANAMLDRLLAEGPPTAVSDASDRASRAEGLALKGRLDEAASSYRDAIDALDDETTRRAWWLNLAEVLARTGDRGKVRDALTAAQAGRGDDEIGDRVGQVLTREGLKTEPTATIASQRLRAN